MAQDYTPEGHYGPEGHLHHSPRQAPSRQGSSRQGSLRQGSLRQGPPPQLTSEKGAAEKAVFEPRYRWEAASEAAALEGATEFLVDVDIGDEWGSEGALAHVLLSAAHTDGAPGAVRERVLSAVDAVLREPSTVPAFPAEAAPVTTLSGVFEKRRPTTEAASCVESPEPNAAIDAARQHNSAVSVAAMSGAGVSTAAVPDARLDVVPCDRAAYDALMHDALVHDALVHDALVHDGLAREAGEHDGSAREGASDEAAAAFDSVGVDSADIDSADIDSADVEGASVDFVEVAATSRPARSSEASGSELAAHGPAGVSSRRAAPVSDGPVVGGLACSLPPPGELQRSRGVHRESLGDVRPASSAGVDTAPPENIEAERSRGIVVLGTAVHGDMAPDAAMAVGGLHHQGLSALAAPGAGVHCFGGPMVGGRCRRATDVDVSGASIPAARVSPAPIPGALAAARTALGSAPGPHAAASGLAPRAADGPHLEAAFAIADRSVSARLRDGVVMRAVNLGQLAAAIVVGIVIGKVAHLVMAEEIALAWSPSEEGRSALRAEANRAVDAVRAVEPVIGMTAVDSLDRAESQTIEPQIIDRGGMRRARRAHSASPARASFRANGSIRAARAANAPPSLPCLASAQALSAPARSPLAGAPLPCQTPLATVNIGDTASVLPLSRGLAAEALQRSNAASPLADGAQAALDDWLGEQLAILGQAERSLREGDPESAIRSLDDYQARFPDGLLGPQMASVRQRLEERFTAFIFP